MNNEDGMFVYFFKKNSYLVATVRQMEYLQLFISRFSPPLLSHLLLLFVRV